MASLNDTDSPHSNNALDVTLDFHLLGTVEWQQVQELQQRLHAAAVDGTARSLPILLCEHPPVITVGRGGSRAHIRLTNDQLLQRNLAVQWLGRGGGCVLHMPGQLCIYPIVPLREAGWSVGKYLRCLQQALMATVARLNLPAIKRPENFGVWGKSGLVAAIGVKVQDWVAHQGAFLNVNPDMSLFRYVDTIPDNEPAPRSNIKASTMSCLIAERRGAVHMSSVRTAVIECLAEAWNADHYHIHAGHPWLDNYRAGVHRSREIA